MPLNASSSYKVVLTKAYLICGHEVTQGEYETYCKYGDTSTTPSNNYGKGSDKPAYFINWYDAIVYCNLRSMAEGLAPCYKIGAETDPTMERYSQRGRRHYFKILRSVKQ